ncbi:MAG: hypothetical protein ACOVOV_02310 [Dolichospermum sp.]
MIHLNSVRTFSPISKYPTISLIRTLQHLASSNEAHHHLPKVVAPNKSDAPLLKVEIRTWRAPPLTAEQRKQAHENVTKMIEEAKKLAKNRDPAMIGPPSDSILEKIAMAIRDSQVNDETK